MEVHLEGISQDGKLPDKHAHDGGNVSPAVGWSGVPPGTSQLAIVFESVTPSTRAPEALWVVYGISPEVDGLPEQLRHAREPAAPVRVTQGRNVRGNVGYDGPLGTAGRAVRYRLRLLALDEGDLPPGLTAEQLEEAARGHVLDVAEQAVAYERPRP